MNRVDKILKTTTTGPREQVAVITHQRVSKRAPIGVPRLHSQPLDVIIADRVVTNHKVPPKKAKYDVNGPIFRNEASIAWHTSIVGGFLRILSETFKTLVRPRSSRSERSSPGLTAGTGGLQGVGATKQWIFEHIAFPMMVLFGKAQSAENGARKFADCLIGKLGKNGELLGAPEGKALGKLQDQKPMNPALTDPVLIRAFWNILEEAVGTVD